MVRTFCASGNHEVVKCGVHGAVGILVALCATYNITAWCLRRDRHLQVNALVYTVAVAWELKQRGIPGLGRKRIESIANRFGTLYELQNATVEEVARVPGMNRALAEKVLNGRS